MYDTIPASMIAVMTHMPVMRQVVKEIFEFVGHKISEEGVEQDDVFFHAQCVKPECSIRWAVTYQSQHGYDKVGWTILLNGELVKSFELIVPNSGFTWNNSKKRRVLNGVHSDFYCIRMQNLR